MHCISCHENRMIKSCCCFTELSCNWILTAVELHISIRQRSNFTADDHTSFFNFIRDPLVDPGIDNKIRIRIVSDQLNPCRAAIRGQRSKIELARCTFHAFDIKNARSYRNIHIEELRFTCKQNVPGLRFRRLRNDHEVSSHTLLHPCHAVIKRSFQHTSDKQSIRAYKSGKHQAKRPVWSFPDVLYAKVKICSKVTHLKLFSLMSDKVLCG